MIWNRIRADYFFILGRDKASVPRKRSIIVKDVDILLKTDAAVNLRLKAVHGGPCGNSPSGQNRHRNP